MSTVLWLVVGGVVGVLLTLLVVVVVLTRAIAAIDRQLDEQEPENL